MNTLKQTPVLDNVLSDGNILLYSSSVKKLVVWKENDAAAA